MRSAASARSRTTGSSSAAVRVAAQERERLGRRHLEDRRPEPALEVALGDRAQADVERPQLAARRAGPRRPAPRARRSASTSGASSGTGAASGAVASRLRRRSRVTIAATSSSARPSAIQNARPIADARRTADVRELLLGLVLRQQRDHLQRRAARTPASPAVPSAQPVAHGYRRDLQLAEREDRGLVAVRPRLRRGRVGGRAAGSAARAARPRPRRRRCRWSRPGRSPSARS